MRATVYRASTADLQPCPLCGGTATLSSLSRAPTWWRVRCNEYECGATTWAMSEADLAVKAWNRRANVQA
jgi:hypothetical protein